MKHSPFDANKMIKCVFNFVMNNKSFVCNLIWDRFDAYFEESKDKNEGKERDKNWWVATRQNRSSNRRECQCRWVLYKKRVLQQKTRALPRVYKNSFLYLFQKKLNLLITLGVKSLPFQSHSKASLVVIIT